jgi:hypothetical protein
LAWYDYFITTPSGAYLKSSIPFIERYKRWRFSRQVTLLPSHHAIGERTLEIAAKGAREFSARFDFTTEWANLDFVAVTPSHLFLAHESMNAHIVPLCYFETDSKREAFILALKGHYPNVLS